MIHGLMFNEWTQRKNISSRTKNDISVVLWRKQGKNTKIYNYTGMGCETCNGYLPINNSYVGVTNRDQKIPILIWISNVHEMAVDWG